MIRIVLMLVAVLLSPLSWAQESQLAPFTTDGCSAFPDGTAAQKQLWQQCCVAHDRAYWLGGSYVDRMQADFELEQCVKQVGMPTVAKVMLTGVRAGGSPFWLTEFRWGYGWPYWLGWLPRGYRELNAQERQLADQALQKEEGRGVILR